VTIGQGDHQVDRALLQRLAAEVDRDQQAMLADAHAADERDASRRRFLRNLALGGTAAGAAVAVAPFLAGVAAAQDASTTTASATGSTTNTGATTTTIPATTTTTAPAQPTTEDKVTLAFIQSLELALAQLYTTAIATTLFSDAVAVVVAEFGSHHRQHGQLMAGMAGKAALGIANETLLAKYTPVIQAAKSEADLLQVCFTIETAAAASYTAVLGQIVGTDPAARLSSIGPIEGRHAVVIGEALGLTLPDYLVAFEPTNLAISPFDYPIQQ
jgi:hypothetical protein